VYYELTATINVCCVQRAVRRAEAQQSGSCHAGEEQNHNEA
jgi:hypothetical protein